MSRRQAAARTPAELAYRVSAKVSDLTRAGWRIVERRPYVLERGRPIAHAAHVVLCVVSLGLWFPIYGIALLTGGVRRVRVETDRRGKVRVRRVRR